MIPTFYLGGIGKQVSYYWKGKQEWCLDNDFQIAADEFLKSYCPKEFKLTLDRTYYFANMEKIRKWLQKNAKGYWYIKYERWDKWVSENDTYTILFYFEQEYDMFLLMFKYGQGDFNDRN